MKAGSVSSWLVWSLLGAVRAQPLVLVQQGMLRGQEVSTVRGNKTYAEFRGIPYARPPIGELRFQEPQPPAPWIGVRNATADGDMCLQTLDGASLMGSEDCLYINVFTPRTSFQEVSGELAVLVYIHGGAYTVGAGNKVIAGPDYFMLEGVLLVTLNYRLGALGYASLQDRHLPGNVGMKDQVAALRWVQRNIASFGGDPALVTIFGESAGASSVHAHLLSPMSAGLFRAAMAQSGTMLCSWAMAHESVPRTQRLASLLNCSRSETRAMLRCLRRVPAADVVLATAKGIVDAEEFLRLDLIPFAPVVDGDIPGVEPFLPKRPEELIAAGQFQKVPFITGMNSAEALAIFAFAKGIMNTTTLILRGAVKTVLTSLSMVLPAFGVLDLAALNEETLLLDVVSVFIQMFTDYGYKMPALRTVRGQAAHGARQYLYYFDYQSVLGRIKLSMPAAIQQVPGVPHMDEIFYMFILPGAIVDLPDQHPAMRTLFRMVRMWSNVARTREPTPRPDALLNATWPAYSPAHDWYLYVGEELEVRAGFQWASPRHGRGAWFYLGLYVLLALTMTALVFGFVMLLVAVRRRRRRRRKPKRTVSINLNPVNFSQEARSQCKLKKY